MVTGGTSGIGFEIAKRMCQEGGKVFVCSVDKDIDEKIAMLNKIGKQPVEGCRCDVTSRTDR